MDIKLYEKDDVYYAAKLALKHRLYVPKNEWQLQTLLRTIVQQRYRLEDSKIFIALAFENEVPVGVCLLYRQQRKSVTFYEISVFVRKTLRGKGIGKALVDTALTKCPKSYRVYATSGIDGSVNFFKKASQRIGVYTYVTTQNARYVKNAETIPSKAVGSVS